MAKDKTRSPSKTLHSSNDNSPSLRRSGRKKTPKKKLSIDGANSKSYVQSTTPSTVDSSSTSNLSPSPPRQMKKRSPSPQKRSTSSLFRGEFYAVRKSNGCEGCIFLKWDQAKPHVIGQNAEFSVFDKMEDAILYIQTPPEGTAAKPQKKRKRTATMPFIKASGNGKKSSVPRHDLMLQEIDISEDDEKPTKRMKPAPPQEPQGPPLPIPEDSRELTVILHEGYSQNKPKGWRASFLFPGDRHDRVQWETRYLQDVATLKECRATDSTLSRDVHNTKHMSGIPNAYSLAYLNWSWGVGEAYHRYLAFQQRKHRPGNTSTKLRRRKSITNMKQTATVHKISNHPTCNTCVITNREAARKRFTARAMFMSFRVAQLSELANNSKLRKEDLPGRPENDDFYHGQSPLVNGCSRKKDWMDEAREDFDELSEEDKAYWKEQERRHDERHPEILGILEANLARDPRRSAKKLSEDIGYWCGKTTIGKWKSLKIGPIYRKGIVVPANDKPKPYGPKSNSSARLSLPISKYDDPTEEEAEDDDTFGDGSDLIVDEDSENLEQGENLEEQENRAPKETKNIPEERKQFLASITVAAVNKKQKETGSGHFPTRISVSTESYIDNHVSSLVASLEPDVSVAPSEVPIDENLII